MHLIRGWESRYAPNETGGLRLSTARLFRNIGEEEGLGDPGEGEIRAAMLGSIESKSTEGPLSGPVDFTIQAEPDQPAVHVVGVEPGEVRAAPSTILRQRSKAFHATRPTSSSFGRTEMVLRMMPSGGSGRMSSWLRRMRVPQHRLQRPRA